LIREALEGKRVLLTGVTGFLGSALLERFLVDLPVERVDVLIRGDAEKRLNWLMEGTAFSQGRQQLGADGLKDLVAHKVRAISCDLAKDDPPIAEDIDLVIHSAATVSFDPPISDAFSTNLLGTLRLFEAVRGRPFIHVSTAYVAGVTRGTQAEEFLNRGIDWRAEAESAAGMSSAVERDSRRPELLGRLQSRARAEMGKAGPQSVAERTEQLRIEWVKDQLVEAGKARARSLGWPDVYGFTKALTEQALDEVAGSAPLSIVRPSIIEGALERPFAGWIEGFRMADPILLAYGRGSLPDFPGIPEGILDLIPVDMVVNAILAVAASPPKTRAVYHVCSGERNPVRFREIYELTRDYFLEHPLPERDRGTYKVPEWSFPGSRVIDRRLRTANRMLETGERLVGRLPRNRFARETARKVDRMRRRFEFVKRYADLYGPYAEAEVVYTDRKARELFEMLPPEDQRDFNFDPSSFSWEHYLQEVHLPTLTMALRWPDATRPEPVVKIREGSQANGKNVIAAFDVEGTIVNSNVPETFLWLRLADTDDSWERAKRFTDLMKRVPGYLKAERRDRGDFLRMFYRQYEGVLTEDLRALARAVMGDLIMHRTAPSAVRRIREHRRAGHHIVFITGSVDFVVEPLRPLADEIITAKLKEVAGRLTGDLERPPLVGEARASWLRERAASIGADLESSFAYADSMSDLPMLQVVGNPVAVNPDVALHRLARQMKWPVEEWAGEKGMPRLLFPASEAVS